MLRCLLFRSQHALRSAICGAYKTAHVFSPVLQPNVERHLHYDATPPPHVFASVDPNNLHVRWNSSPDVLNEIFPLVWLRAHCQCPKCFHPETKSRQVLGRQLQLDPKVANYVVKEDHIEVIWDDGHESSYTNEWLQARSFRHPVKDPAHPKRKPWNRSFTPKSFSFDSTLTNDSAMIDFLLEFTKRGICVMRDAPPNALERLAEAVFDFPMKTHYGEFFEVKTKPLPSNLAYTSAELGLHNDLPFHRNIPHIQVLHCLLQTEDLEGGANLFSDVSFVVNRLRKENPEAFELLTTEKASYMDIGKDVYSDFHMRFSRPVISLDPVTNELLEVAYNHAVMDSYFHIHRDRVKPWFQAIAFLQNLVVEESIRWRLKTGELVIFDNRRCLHGREGYRANTERHLRGCYFLWDYAESRLRVLLEKNQG